ncbi:MAG TPA: hypothetical protein VGE11_26540, partial [Pseudonocardia sp.]
MGATGGAEQGRGEYLLRRVLAGSGALPPDWSGPGDVLGEANGAGTAGGAGAGGAEALKWPSGGPEPTAGESSPLRHAVRLPARGGRTAPWPEWVAAPVRATFVDHGVRAPWTHQVQAAELAHAGQ